jgi:hypothetical protein
LRPLLALFLVTAAIHLAISCSLPKYAFDPVGNCEDGTQNGVESDKDCGGRDCEKCDIGLRCRNDGDCANASCADGLCRAAHCANDKTDEGETDVNCGGKGCPKCLVSQRCIWNSDCASNACVDKICIATNCDDENLGDDETDVDCGGGTCQGCEWGKRCNSGGDCESGFCIERQCSTAECGNGQKDGGEDAVDCGGTCPRACACGDGVPNSDESDTDCGGVECLPCGLGKTCNKHRDCDSVFCSNGRCAMAPCEDAPMPCMEDPDAGVGGTTGGTPNTPEGGGSGGTSGGSAPTGGTSNGGTHGGTPNGGAPMAGSAQGGGGNGGTAGASAGSAGLAGSGGTGASPPLTTCTGCARLEAPFDSSDDKANFVINLPNTVFLGNAQITFRVYREAGTGGAVKGYIQHGGSPDFHQLFQSNAVRLSVLKGWTEFTWNVGAQEAPNYDKNVARIGIQITAEGSTEWAKPTIVYLDSITVTNASAGPWTFNDGGTIITGDPMCPATHSSRNVLWCNGGDSPVSGTRITWLGE